MVKNNFTKSQKAKAPIFIPYPCFLFPFHQRQINPNLKVRLKTMSLHSMLKLWILKNYYKGFIFSENYSDNCIDNNNHYCFKSLIYLILVEVFAGHFHCLTVYAGNMT